MKLALHALVFLLCACHIRSDDTDSKVFCVEFSVREKTKRQDWSGRAGVSTGKITRIELESDSTDRLKPDGSWELISHRNSADAARKGIVLTVHAPTDASITIHTRSGDFTFCICDATPEGLDKLDGNVRVFLGRSEHLREPATKNSTGGKR